jgi:serine/threonine protein kinase
MNLHTSASPKSSLESIMHTYPSRLRDEFSFIRRLGAGAFGFVVEMKNKLDSRNYAIKIIGKEAFDADDATTSLDTNTNYNVQDNTHTQTRWTDNEIHTDFQRVSLSLASTNSHRF